MEVPLRLHTREAAIEDVGELTAIDAACFPPEDRYARGLMEDIVRGKFMIESVDKVSTTVALEGTGTPWGERIVGFITVARDRDSGVIVTLDVHPRFRRRGIGRMLLGLGESRLLEWGVRFAVITVGARNSPAQELYGQEGYKFMQRIPHYYESGDDALALCKELG